MRKQIFQPLLLAIILAIGFGTVWATVAVWAKEQVRHATQRLVFELLELRADGTPVVRHEIIWRPGDAPPTPTSSETSLDTASLPSEHYALLLGLEYGWEWRLKRFTDARFPGLVWHFVTDGQRHGSAYFVGYDERTKLRIGFLGTAGFRADALPAEERFPFRGDDRGIIFRLYGLQMVPYRPFAANPQAQRRDDVEMPWQMFVQGDDDRVYQVDLGSRTVRIAFEGEHIQSTALLVRSAPASAVGRRDILVRTDDSIVVINGRDGSQRRFTIPTQLRNTSFIFGETTAGEGLACWTLPYEPGADILTYRVAWFDAAGHVIRRDEADVHVAADTPGQIWSLGIILPVPLLEDVYVTVIRPYRLPLYEPPPSYLGAVRRELADHWPSLLSTHLISAVLAVLCWRRQVKYRTDRAERIVWPLFVFLFGLPGWIGYRYGRTWPSLERCPDCGATVPRDRVDCAACAADFPLPQLRGTEVFA
jgi:hypothetical protein